MKAEMEVSDFDFKRDGTRISWRPPYENARYQIAFVNHRGAPVIPLRMLGDHELESESNGRVSYDLTQAEFRRKFEITPGEFSFLMWVGRDIQGPLKFDTTVSHDELIIFPESWQKKEATQEAVQEAVLLQRELPLATESIEPHESQLTVSPIPEKSRSMWDEAFLLILYVGQLITTGNDKNKPKASLFDYLTEIPNEHIRFWIFPLYDATAHEWVYNTRIPGMYVPILYIDPNISAKLAAALGRPIRLEEARRLVQLDGGLVLCAATLEPFQPLKYVVRLPANLAEQLKTTEFKDITLKYHGCFLVAKNGWITGLSGALFRYNHSNKTYTRTNGSPLAWAKREKLAGYRKWCVPLEIAQKRKLGLLKAA